jgi:hypothetical protein
MQRNYTLAQRCVAYVLLISFFGQSCYNPSVPSNPLVSKEERQIVKMASFDPEEEPIDLISREFVADLGIIEKTKEVPTELKNSTTRIGLYLQARDK